MFIRFRRQFGKKRVSRKNPDAQMPVLQHLRELKNRLLISLAVIFLAAIFGWFFYERVFYALQQPIREAAMHTGNQVQINFDAVASSLDMRVKLSFFIGLIVASPLCIYQLWAFIVPALKRKEKQRSLIFFFTAFPLFAFGVYGAWLFLPNLVRTLTGFTPEGSSNIISAQAYFDFITRLMLVSGFAFMAPVFLVAVNATGVITGKQLLKSWRIIVFAVFLLAAMASPGSDATTMFYLAVPLLVLYAAALGVCLGCDRLREKKKLMKSSEPAMPTSYEKLDTIR